MQNADAQTSERWLAPAFLIVVGVTLLRVVFLWFDRTDLFVDEAQYWLWGQDLEFGYYSKPPLIGWVIRASVELAGSDAPFWVRLPAPLFHATTSLIVGWIAATRFGPKPAVAVVAAFITLPLITAGSFQISTDTIMYPFIAVGLGAWVRVLDTRSTGWAALAGFAVGVGFMAKYAAIYMVLCAGIAALHPSARPGWKATAIALLAFAIAIAPNVIWNIQNGLNTVQHTLDNADWIRDPGERTAYNLSGMIEFFTSQFAVFGPIFFTALLVGWIWPGRDKRLFTVFALPIIAIVCVQAYLSQAYANWAVAAYLGGTLAVVPWLWKVARWSFWTSLVLHGGFAVLVPLATVFGETWAFGNPNGPALERYFGRAEMSNQILDKARSEGLGTVVSGNRDILADLFYTGRDAEIVIRAQPVAGRPPHHYALKFSYVPQQGESVLYVSRESAPLPECDLVQLGRIAPESGAYRKRPMILSRASSDCFRIP